MKGLRTRCISTLASAAIIGSLLSPNVFACTRVLWAPGDDVLVGRTQDWTEKVNSSFRVFPRGIERLGTVDKNPLKWTTQFGSLVITGYDAGTHEGVNEKGLSAHILYLAADNASFGDRNEKRPAINVMQWAQYYLDNFATVADAVNATKQDRFQIVPMELPNGKPALIHLSIEDASGDSAVIEYIDGKPRVYHDKRFTVMTNEPTYDKQIENLKQYRSFGGDKPLPGERTPSDRFVRAAYYSSVLPKPKDAPTAAAYMFSVMRNVSVPFGAADPDKPNVSNTIFRTVKNLSNGDYFFESTYAPNVVWVNYKQFDYKKGNPELMLRVENDIFKLNGDVSHLLKPAKAFVFAGE